MDFQTQFNKYLNDINSYLEAVIGGKNGKIYDAMRYSLYAGGKRIRPILTLACCDALNGKKNAALCFGSSLEMIHTYSLIHDDLPCMDNDDLRRGKPTNHIVYGENIAVLAGDGLLNFACENIVKAENIDAELKLKALDIIYSASGADGMIQGQMLDLAAETVKISGMELQELHRKKTGALIKAASSLGAICSGESETLFDTFSDSVGLAFQIRDDILDIEGDEAVFGKPIRSDEKNEKTTYVTLYGIDGAKHILSEETEKALDSIEFLGEKGEFLRNLAMYLLNRTN